MGEVCACIKENKQLNDNKEIEIGNLRMTQNQKAAARIIIKAIKKYIHKQREIKYDPNSELYKFHFEGNKLESTSQLVNVLIIRKSIRN